VALGLLDFHPLDRPRAVGIAEVGEEPESLRLDEQGGVRALEAGQIEDVRRRRDEERLLEEAAELDYVRVRNSSASL
jgi:hypothetical protein